MRKRKITKKNVWSMILAAALIVSAATPAIASTAMATTMKLEKTEGTVTLKTQNGSARKITNGMRLINGNTLSTAASSYAHISLDGSKAVKMDEKSVTTVRQSGTKLELLVKSGKLFFNVSQPLKEKESLNIRTSSMVTGIRGTCGVVEYVNPNKSKLYLIQGQVTLGYGENATTVYGGQTATVILREKEEAGESGGSGGSDTPGDSGSMTEEVVQKVYVDKLTEKDVPIFAITEILSDPVLQQKIEATTDLEIKKLEEVLEESQNPEGTEEEKEEEKEEEQKQEETTSSGGGSYYPSTPDGSTTGEESGGVTELPDTLTGSDVTAANVAAAFGTYDTVTLAVDESTSDSGDDSVTENPLITLSGEISIPNGKTLVLDGATTISVGSTITVVNGGTLKSIASLTNMGSIKNDGTIESPEMGVILASGSELANNGTIRGIVTMESGSTLDNNGTIEGYVRLSENDQTDGQISNKTTIKNAAGKELTADGDWNVSNAIIENAGSINMVGYAIVVTDTLNLKQVGTITGSGDAVISVSGGALKLGVENGSAGESISNTGSGYAIAVSGGSITWNDTGVTIYTEEGQINNTIQGLELGDANAVIDSGKILTYVSEKYNLIWDGTNKELSLKELQ